MLESILNTSVANTTITVGTILSTIGISLFLGLIICFTYNRTNRENYSENFMTALLVLPTLMSTVILLIGNNIAGAFSLAGIFSIIRFRSAPGSAKDIIYVLFCVGAGLACGIQAYTYGLIFVCILCGILLILIKTPFGKKDNTHMKLKILVPEDLNDENAFDDILKKYTKRYDLERMRTKDLGSIYELTYNVVISTEVNKKEFIDNLRCRNGNLNISLTIGMSDNEF